MQYTDKDESFQNENTQYNVNDDVCCDNVNNVHLVSFGAFECLIVAAAFMYISCIRVE